LQRCASWFFVLSRLRSGDASFFSKNALRGLHNKNYLNGIFLAKKQEKAKNILKQINV
jgi:hypothetical protein